MRQPTITTTNNNLNNNNKIHTSNTINNNKDKYGNKNDRFGCRKYGKLRMIQDLFMISVLISLLTMNYLNMSVLRVLYGDYSNSVDEPMDSDDNNNSSLHENPTLHKPSKRTTKRKSRAKRKARKAVRQKRISTSGTEASSTSTLSSSSGVVQVLESDRIYRGLTDSTYSFDAAPIVVEEHKLVFFSVPKVACTTFKFLFRKIAGHHNWDVQTPVERTNLPHNPKHNGLKYLWDYSPAEATAMMNDPDWTRAIFVREPKTRFLSAYLDKAVGNYGIFLYSQCCPEAMECRKNDPQLKKTNMTFAIQNCQSQQWDSRNSKLTNMWLNDKPCCQEFATCYEDSIASIVGFLDTIETCKNGHWDPQTNRMEPKYWKKLNFVGRMETIGEDTERLLKKIGAWEEHGATGWGPKRDKSILEVAAGKSQSHTTGSAKKIHHWFNPSIERLVEDFYQEDYDNPLLNYTKTNLTVPADDGKVLKKSDYIYKRGDWDGAPIVVEKYKLVFFTLPKVGATRWKQAFRRMEGYSDWNTIDGSLPHDPDKNGLKYLYDFSIHKAEEIMTSADWTRAIFVRSPKDRFLSVYWQMRNDPKQIDRRCCPHDVGCSKALGSRDMVQFIQLAETCFSTHWAPYSERFGPIEEFDYVVDDDDDDDEDNADKDHRGIQTWWEHMDFIGKVETVDVDAERLLKMVGAWESTGKSGWGLQGDEPIFRKDADAFQSVHQSLGMYSKKADRLLNNFYALDYENPFLNFTSKQLHITIE